MLYLRLIGVSCLLAACARARTPDFDKSSLASGSFYETFDNPNLDQAGWHVSKGLKEGKIPYNGVWKIEESHRYAGYAGDLGLVMTTEADYYSIYKRLEDPVTSEGKDLVFQYEVKFQHGIECGGAYFKLVSDDSFNPSNFSDQVRYEVMFGPDICGSENRVKFIYTKDTHNESFQSELRTPPMARKSELLTLYTLIIRANLEVEIRINGETAKKGHMINTPHFMKPALSVPQFIPDTSVRKPEDWDDKPVILDTSATKPEDWDETYGRETIPDPSVSKPEGWNDDPSVSLQIPDPRYPKPSQWIDSEDGEWEPPMVVNPKCAHGCGEWKAPEIANPEYKGEWQPAYIVNPNYKGEWKPPMMENPEYSNLQSYSVKPITGVGMEAWTMQSGVMFNNIYLGNSVADAERLGNETFLPKLDLELDNYKLTAPKPRHAPQRPPPTFEDFLQEESALAQLKRSLASIVDREISFAKEFWASFKVSPNETVARDPFRFAIYCFVFLVSFVFVFGTLNVAMFIILMSRNAEAAGARKQPEKEGDDTKAKLTVEAAAKMEVDSTAIPEVRVEVVSSESEHIGGAGGSSGVKLNDTVLERRH